MPSSSPPEIKPFQAIILILSILTISALAAELIFDIPTEAQRVIRWADTCICVLFLIDFCIQFKRAESKLRFMKWGWIDLLASIPEIEALRWGRLFRVFRILRIFLLARSLREFISSLFKNRTEGGVASVFLITFLVLVFSSVAILFAERTTAANIRSAGDAVWWSVTTITTVGYGDKYPVTHEGRMIAGLLMITGVGLFGTLSGVIASFFLGHHRDQQKKDEELMQQFNELKSEIAILREQASQNKHSS